MSISVMNAVWQHSKSDGRARLVLLAIADHQGEIGSWPSIATLARMVNSSERSVQRDIQHLQSLGELSVEVQNAPTRHQYKSNLYWVTLPGVTAGVTDKQSGVTDSMSGVTESASGVTAGGALTITRTLKESLLEPSYKIPDDFQPKQSDIDVMREHFPDIDLKLETHAFKDYWKAIAGVRGKKTDWDATWRNWIRNSAKRFKPQGKTDWDELSRYAREQDAKNEQD